MTQQEITNLVLMAIPLIRDGRGEPVGSIDPDIVSDVTLEDAIESVALEVVGTDHAGHYIAADCDGGLYVVYDDHGPMFVQVAGGRSIFGLTCRTDRSILSMGRV